MTRRQLFSVLSATSAFILLVGFQWTAWAQNEENAAPAIRLVVDYSQGVEKHWTSIEWREGMTVLGAMERVRDLDEPWALRYDQTGRGPMAFIKAIDGLENEGGGEGERNWIFRVNGEVSERGCGATTLEAGDVVRWSFQAYNMEDE